MQASEIRAAGELAGRAIGGAPTFVSELHAAIAHRPFRILGPPDAAHAGVHDRISGTAYTTISRGLGAAPRAGAALLARTAPPEAPALSRSVGGSLALAALNGAIGDRLAERGSDLALSMSLRHRGEDVVPERLADAGSRIAVFVHGLSETDDAWRLLPLRRERTSDDDYGERLRRELGYTPLYVRYNTGLRISDNGRRLTRLLEETVAAWPVEVDDIVLVGHSMGGLVARSACHYGAADGARWVAALRHVFCLGSPHLGAPLEKAVNLLGWALGRVAETRPLAKVVNGRSVGIKDLRFGSCVEEDWCDCEPDEFLRDRCREVPFLDTATYYFVGATLSRGPVGSLLGDLLVRFPSASGRGRSRRIPFEVDHGRRLTGLTHFDLLNHPAVYDQMRTWLSSSTGPAASSRAARTRGLCA